MGGEGVELFDGVWDHRLDVEIRFFTKALHDLVANGDVLSGELGIIA